MNCIIIHGCPSDKEKDINPELRTYDKHWIPWVKKELIKLGVPTETPLMPSPWLPVYEDFKKEFDGLIVDEKTVLVGHSCGCSFLVRWLGDTKQKIAKLILVAPWKIPENAEHWQKNFYEYTIDKTIQSRVGSIIIFTSDNEAREGQQGAVMFHDNLGGRIVSLSNHGHYILQHMGTEQFPELLHEVLVE